MIHIDQITPFGNYFNCLINIFHTLYPCCCGDLPSFIQTAISRKRFYVKLFTRFKLYKWQEAFSRNFCKYY